MPYALGDLSVGAKVRLLENRGLVHMMQPPRATARAALLGLLSTNRDLAEVFLDQCYSPQAIVSRVYFQVPFHRRLCHMSSCNRVMPICSRMCAEALVPKGLSWG